MNEWVNFFNEEEFCKANWKHFSTVLFLNLFRSFFPSFEVGFGKRTLVSTLRSIIQIIGHLFMSLIFSYLLLVTCLPMFSCRFGSYLFKIKCLGVFRKTRRSPIHFINQFKWISFWGKKSEFSSLDIISFSGEFSPKIMKNSHQIGQRTIEICEILLKVLGRYEEKWFLVESLAIIEMRT